MQKRKIVGAVLFASALVVAITSGGGILPAVIATALVVISAGLWWN